MTSIAFVSIGSVNAWHENLGITDQQATELMRANPNDPSIVQWKNAMQKRIDSDMRCLDPGNEPIRNICNDLIILDYQRCLAHPGALIACMDPRISQWIQNMQNSTNN